MPERDDDREAYQEKAPPKMPREEHVQSPKPPPMRPQDDDWADDERDDRPRRRRGPPIRRDDDAVSTIIPYRNGLALAGYYVGVFSLVPIFGFVLGPLGLIFGIVGLRRVNRNPEVKGTGHAVTAIVLGGLSSLLHYGFLVLLFVGYFASRR